MWPSSTVVSLDVHTVSRPREKVILSPCLIKHCLMMAQGGVKIRLHVNVEVSIGGR
jgi:hypothetical protein